MRSAPNMAPALSLDSLMSRYQQADEEAARALIQSVSPQLLRYFTVQESTRRFADDLLQDTWMRIHKARHTYRGGEPVLPWIFAIARYAILDNYRRVRRIELRELQVDELPHAATPPADSTAREIDMDVLLASLTQSQREVVLMLKVSGMSIEEVARATRSTAGSVKQKAHRAYQKLRDILLRKVGTK
jgi:RNA polymerase sigma-70 factor, ECF subfamily